MTLKCKYCGADTELTEEESAEIRADLDRRYTREEQAHLPMSVICGRCVPRHTARIVQAAADGALRLKRIRADRSRRPSVRHVPRRWRDTPLN